MTAPWRRIAMGGLGGRPACRGRPHSGSQRGWPARLQGRPRSTTRTGTAARIRRGRSPRVVAGGGGRGVASHRGQARARPLRHPRLAVVAAAGS